MFPSRKLERGKALRTRPRRDKGNHRAVKPPCDAALRRAVLLLNVANGDSSSCEFEYEFLVAGFELKIEN